jgi:acyl-CoA thioesterase-2
MPMPAARPPEELRSNAARLAEAVGAPLPAHLRESPIELRSAGPLSIELARDPSLRGEDDHNNLVWVRVTERLPDEPLLHVCLMTYISDLTLLETALLEHGLSWFEGNASGASLDHAMWFHRPFRADQWLLYAQDSPVAAGGRVLARGQVFTEEGDLVVSVVQEGLIRISEPPRD